MKLTNMILSITIWLFIYKIPKQTSGQGGGIGKHTSHLHTTIAKNIATVQNKYHPELSENQAVWKSNNQGSKEATFIQIGRRGKDVERSREAWRGGEIWRCRVVQRGAGMGTGVPTSTCDG